MTNLEALIKIVGSRAKLARIIGCVPSHVDSLVWPGRKHRDVLPSKHNKSVLLWASEELSEDQQEEVFGLLENECPHCHRAY